MDTKSFESRSATCMLCKTLDISYFLVINVIFWLSSVCTCTLSEHSLINKVSLLCLTTDG